MVKSVTLREAWSGEADCLNCSVRASALFAGLAERDRLVLDRCACDGIPVAVVMSGGYGREVSQTVDIHLATIRAAAVRTREATPA